LEEPEMENTIKNLAKAFIGESQARNRYTMYAKIAQVCSSISNKKANN